MGLFHRIEFLPFGFDLVAPDDSIGYILVRNLYSSSYGYG